MVVYGVSGRSPPELNWNKSEIYYRCLHKLPAQELLIRTDRSEFGSNA